MKMESPVRICLGAALVVNLLLLGTSVSGNVLPQTTPAAVNEKAARLNRVNATWVTNKPSTPDISINELNPKESVSEEHTEKNAKYKDRGRVRYFTQPKSSTESSLRRVKTSTEAASLVIVTPTPEMVNPVDVEGSMTNNKITKTIGSTSTTTHSSVDKEEQSIEEYDNEDDEEHEREFEQFTSSKFHENFFTLPSFDDSKSSFNNKVKQDYTSPSHGFSNYFPGETSYGYNEPSNNNYKSENFFDFIPELTTPKNDFFDKKYQEISGSIIKKLESINVKSPPPNKPDIKKVVKENVGLEKLSNKTPSNKSTVFIKNTKEIRMSDNEGAAGSTNTALSDVHGTSIYYEMSVLSTETYAINHSNDYDCENDTLPSDTTVNSSSEEELASVNATKPTIIQVWTRPPFPDPTEENIPNFILSSSVPLSSSVETILTENIASSTERTSKVYVSSFSRNRNYSKRLNLSGTNDSSNNVTPKPEVSSYIPYSRKFYHTTPRNRPIWMAPKRNVTKISFTRNTPPTTIYSEHFNIKDKIPNAIKPKQPAKTTLSTASLDIDPVLQSEVSGTKKIVHTQSTSDNSIPSLWKRGSTKYRTSTMTTTAVSNLSEMEIPPTSVAWALAALKSPSVIQNPFNITSSTHKSIDENELQKVGEVLDKGDDYTTSLTTTTLSPVREDVTKKIIEVDQNKLHWQPTFGHITPSFTKDGITTTEAKSERLAAESSIPAQSTAESKTTETVKNKPKIFVPAWIPTSFITEETTQSETIPPVDATRSTGFESITKLPSGVTTPRDETIVGFESNGIITQRKPTTDYEITTIRFSYVPTESVDITEENISNTETSTVNSWHPIIPTRTKYTSIKDISVTTYRPKYITTTETVDESTVTADITSPVIEVSSQILENATDILTLQTTEVHKPTAVTKSSTTETVSELTTETSHLQTIKPTNEVTTEVNSTDIKQYMTEMITETTFTETTKPITETTNEETFTETSEPIAETTIPPTEAEINESTQPSMIPETTTTMATTTAKTTTKSATTPLLPTTIFTSTTPEETTTIVVEEVTEINTEREKTDTTTQKSVTETEMDNEVTTDCSSEENENSNEIITQSIPTSSTKTTTVMPTIEKLLSTTEKQITTEGATTTVEKILVPTQTVVTKIETTDITESFVPEDTTIVNEVISEATTRKAEEIKPTHKEEASTVDCSTENELTTKAVNALEDLNTEDYGGEMTTEASSRVLSEESGTGAAVAIAVSTIGVIALVLLIGLLLVVRRRGRRGVYAQRCTPVSLDAYSLDSVSVGHRKGNHRLRASKRSYGNPAYDDEVTSHPMQYPALANFALDIESMTAEFAEIPSVTVRHEEVPPGCEDKNRYSNVLPLPETRVPLSRINNDPSTEYINANYITGPGNIRNYYIACQAPLANTVVDFWRMIWEQNSRLVVMLTEYMENGVEKCYEYLPPSEITDNKRTFGDFKIILKKREQRDKYAISSVQVINMATRTWREVTHLWYFWPAKGVPDDYDSVIDFLSEMRSYMKISQTAKEYDEEGIEVIYGDQNRSSYGNLAKLRSEEYNSGNGVNVYSPAKAEEVMRRHANGTLGRMKAASEIEGVRPCVVTCASGAGRSAVLIALDISARALAAGCADVPRAVRHLRAQRPHSLSNRHHYILLYKILSEYGNKLMGGGVDTI